MEHTNEQTLKTNLSSKIGDLTLTTSIIQDKPGQLDIQMRLKERDINTSFSMHSITCAATIKPENLDELIRELQDHQKQIRLIENGVAVQAAKIRVEELIETTHPFVFWSKKG